MSETVLKELQRYGGPIVPSGNNEIFSLRSPTALPPAYYFKVVNVKVENIT
jgi:hypothetical protein